MAYTTIVILVSALSNNFISFFTIINDDYSTLANYVYSIILPFACFHHFGYACFLHPILDIFHIHSYKGDCNNYL